MLVSRRPASFCELRAPANDCRSQPSRSGSAAEEQSCDVQALQRGVSEFPKLPKPHYLPPRLPAINWPSLRLHPLCPRVLPHIRLANRGPPPFRLLLCLRDCHPLCSPTHVFCLSSTLPSPVPQSPLATLSSSVSGSFPLNV